MSSGILVPEQFIASTLTGDATLMAMVSGVYEAPADKPTGVYVTFYRMRPGTDVTVVAGNIVFTNELYQVAVHKQTDDYNDILPAFERVHLLLHLAEGVVSQGRVLRCRRVNTISQKAIEDNLPYRKLGGIYQIYVQ